MESLDLGTQNAFQAIWDANVSRFGTRDLGHGTQGVKENLATMFYPKMKRNTQKIDAKSTTFYKIQPSKFPKHNHEDSL